MRLGMLLALKQNISLNPPCLRLPDAKAELQESTFASHFIQ
jgi:hypothetical protein